jgi:hypothetical protein
VKLKNIFRTRYRIIPDIYCGYSVKYRTWFSPFWYNIGSTYKTLEEAKYIIAVKKQSAVWEE